MPRPARDFARRLIHGPPAPERERLTFALHPDRVVISGTVGPDFRVTGLDLRLSKSWSGDTQSWKQSSSREFSFTINLPQLLTDTDASEGSWDFHLRVHPADKPEAPRVWRLGRFNHTFRDEAIHPVEVAGTTVWPHITKAGNLSLLVGPEPSRAKEHTTHRLSVGPKAVHLESTLRTFSRRVTSIEGAWIGRFDNTVTPVPVEFTDTSHETQWGHFQYRVKAELDPAIIGSDLPHVDEIYDPWLLVTLEDVDMPLRVGIHHHSRVRDRIRDIAVRRENGVHVLVPYVTFRTNRLAFWSEKFDADAHRFGRRLSLISWLFWLVRPFTGIWLVGEIPYKAQDNGFHFFRWLRLNHPKRRAYYVIDRESPDAERVAALGNTLWRHSKKHILYTMLASRFVGSHHAEYLFASRSAAISDRARGIRVFLQHGVTGAKNVRLNYGRRFVQERPADVFVVCSELERSIAIQELDFLPSQVPITGFARFDELFTDDTPDERRIILMPTWRDWLGHGEAFPESAFYHYWRELLHDRGLVQAAADHGMEIAVLLHANMRQFTHHFASEGITVLPPGTDVQKLLKSSSLMITDYSSVAWDFAFLDKPVIYFQFDQHALHGPRQPFIDFTTMLPGDVCRTSDEVIVRLRETLARDCQPTAEHRRRAHAFLEHHDRSSNERIFDVVRSADGPRMRLTRLRNMRSLRNTYNRFRASTRYHWVMTWVFRCAQVLPKRKLIMFESDRGTSYGGNPRALYERMLERGSDHELVVVNNTHVRLPDVTTQKVRRFTPKYYWLMGRASHWVTNQNAADQFRPGRRTHYLQTWHGTPLKRMQNDVSKMHGRDDDYHARARKLVSAWSSLVSPSSFATTAFRSAFGFEGPIIESGYPANDIFHSEHAAQRARETRARLGVPADRKIVLYAPTFRDNQRKGAHWSADLTFDIGGFRERFGEDTTLLVRFHPLVRFQWPKSNADTSVIDVSRYPDTQDLLLIADVLITDYSSIMFDFAQTGRPMLFFTYDIEMYRDELRGFYFDFENEAPGPLLRTPEEVLKALGDLAEIETDHAERLVAFRERFGGLEDGHASDRVIDFMLGGQGQASGSA